MQVLRNSQAQFKFRVSYEKGAYVPICNADAVGSNPARSTTKTQSFRVALGKEVCSEETEPCFSSLRRMK